MTDRDYSADMLAVLADALPNGDVVLPVVAAELAGKLRANDPDLLAGWLDLHAEHVLTDVLGMRLRSGRARHRAQAGASAFAEASAARDAGDGEALSVFDLRYVVGDDNRWRRLGEMTAVDHLYVADHYAHQSHAAALLEAFHRAVAKKVGKRTTAAALDEAQYSRLFRSIVGAKPQAA